MRCAFRPETRVCHRHLQRRGASASLGVRSRGCVRCDRSSIRRPRHRSCTGTLELWCEIGQCTVMLEKTLDYCDTYTSCAASVEVTLCSLPNTGHIFYQKPVNFDVPKVAW